MSSVVVLNSENRKIPYFSDISPDEKEIVVPRPLINESIFFSVEYMNLETLTTIVENRVYLGLENEEFLIKELIWKLGETKELWEKQSSILQHLIKPYLEIDSYKYIYGIRYLIPLNRATCGNIAKYGNLRLLKWAREEKDCQWGCEVIDNAYNYNHLNIYKYFVRTEKLTFDVMCDVNFIYKNIRYYYIECYSLCLLINVYDDSITHVFEGRGRFEKTVTQLNEKQVNFTKGMSYILKYNIQHYKLIIDEMLHSYNRTVIKEKAESLKILIDYTIKHDLITVFNKPKFTRTIKYKLDEIEKKVFPGPYNPIEWVPLARKKLFPELSK